MASQRRSLDCAASGPKGHVASIVLCEPSTFDTKTPSNSREAVCCPRRPLHFSDSSDGSRCNSLNNKMGAATTIVELQGLNELLFGAIQVLCQQPGDESDASRELTQLAAMASKVPPQDAGSFDKYRKDLQDSCRRMASALPPRPPNQRAHSEPEFADPYAELAPRAPQQAMSANGQPQLDSPFTTSVSKVIMPRIPSSSSRASSTASIGSSKRSSRLRIGPNPFEAANSTDAIEEGNEEEEVDVQQVMTPGGSIREVLVRCSFDHLVGRSESLFREALPGKGTAWAAGTAQSGNGAVVTVASVRSVPQEVAEEQLGDGVKPASRKAASGQLTEADVMQAISNAGMQEVPSTSSAAANPFAAIRAVVEPAALPAGRKPGSPRQSEAPVRGTPDAAIRSASESGPPESALTGEALASAANLNRLSDPSPHSSGSSAAAARLQAEERQKARSGSSGPPATASAPLRSAQTKADGQERSKAAMTRGSEREGLPEKAKSGCWCF